MPNIIINDELCEKWNKNKLINPITNRKITENSTIYKKFNKFCNKTQNKGVNKIQKIFMPFIKRVSANITDRINYYLYLHKKLLRIKKYPQSQ